MSSLGQEQPALLDSFTLLYYFSKLLGVYPQDWRAFRDEQRLRKSTVGAAIVVIVAYAVFVCYNIMVFTFDDFDFRASLNNLNLLISWALTYSSPLLMFTDLFGAIYNQRKLDTLLQRIDAIDGTYRKHNIPLPNRTVKRNVRVMVVCALIWELASFAVTYVLMETERWTSLLWIFSCVPTFFDSLDKIWFVGLMMSVRVRFAQLNAAINALAEKQPPPNRKYGKLHFLHKSRRLCRVQPECRWDSCFGECVRGQLALPPPIGWTAAAADGHVLRHSAAFEDKMTAFSQLHDSLCLLARDLNDIWGYSLLIMLGYGFVIFTAHLYFTFCAFTDQAIPALFRLAKMPAVISFYLLYIASKSVVLMYTSWSTSQESKRTGICLHRCGVSANSNDIYEIVNHLSLKLLNHRVQFSACGLFSLDMSTLFAITGGITSYVIIFIQFNLAGQQAKSLASSSAVTANFTQFVDYLWYLPKA